MNCITETRHSYGFFENVLYYGACHYGKYNIPVAGYCQQQISQDCADSGITPEKFAQSKIVFSFLAEGHTADDVKPLTDLMQQTHPGQFMVLFNSVFDVSQLPYHAQCVQDFLIKGNHAWKFDKDFDIDSVVPDKKFLCLMRRPSVSRARLGQFLIEHVGLGHTLMSFGSQSMFGLKGYRPFFPNHELPILIDGVISNGEMFYDAVFKPNFYSCVFNIAAESSSQSDEHVWRSVFLTEKTWKPIMQYQLPIWYGVPGLVDQVRQLGFDVFDDVLDQHSYDLIDDEAERYQQVFSLISRLNQQYSLEDCRQLRSQLKPRLVANYERLVDISKTINPRITAYIKEFINIQGTL